MPTLINKLSSARFSALFINLYQSPMINSAYYLNYLQRMHKSGPHARPIYKGPLTKLVDPETNKEKLVLKKKTNTLAYAKLEVQDAAISELTDFCGAPNYREISEQIYGSPPFKFESQEIPLKLKSKGQPEVEVEPIELESIPRAILGGDLAFAVLSQTADEHKERMEIVKSTIDEFKKIGIVEGSGRLRQYTCGYAGPYGSVSTSEVLIAVPHLFEKNIGQPQHIKNLDVLNFLIKVFTPGNNADATFIDPKTDKPFPYVAWLNRDESEKKDGTAVEGKFLISGAYTGHIANAITFKLQNNQTILLMTEAEMVENYLVETGGTEPVNYKANQKELQSPNVVNRMHEKTVLKTDYDPENNIWGVFEEEQIHDLINANLMASGSVLFYVEHNLPNPIGSFGIALYMTCKNGLPIGPYVADNGNLGWGSNCMTYNETLFLAGGGKPTDLYKTLNENAVQTAGQTTNYSPLFIDGYLRAIKGVFRTVYTYGGTLADYAKIRNDVNKGGDTKFSKDALENARRAVRNEILFGLPVERERKILDKGMKLQLNSEARYDPAEQFVYLVANAVSFLELRNRMYDNLNDFTDLTEDEKKKEPPELLEVVNKAASNCKKKSEDKIVKILSDRNRVNLCAAASILAYGITSQNDNDEENLTLKMIQGDAMFIAEEISKGNTPDISQLTGKMPPKD